MKVKILRSGVGALMLLCLTLPGIGPVDARSTTFSVADPMGRDVVSFNSDAPIELIVGRTGKITGSVSVDESLNLRADSLKAEFTVDLASIDTGIEMRNQHMRDNFLETAKFPDATFRLSRIESGGMILKPNQPVRIMARGEFSVHGKSVTRVIPVTVTYFPPCDEELKKSRACDAILIKATFPVKLEEHGIKRPEMVFQKLADTVFVTVSATARKQES